MSRPDRHRIGIVAGSGPEAGIDLWCKVLAENRRRLGPAFRGDIDAPDVTIVSVPELGHSMDLPTTADTVWAHLREACARLAEQVDVFAIACNTLYTFEPELRALDLSAALISPVDAVIAELHRRGVSRVALLGAAPVTDLAAPGSPYARLAEIFDVETPTDPARLHRLIEAVKVAGRATPALATEFAAIADTLSSSTVLLACTELPLVADPTDARLIDVTELVAMALLAHVRS